MLTWQDDETFEIGGIEYVCRPAGGRFKSEPGRFCLLKPRREVEQYERLLTGLAPQRIVEVGTYDGASAALFAELARPEKLVTIDRRATPSDALTHFIATRGFGGVVSAYCGVDQGDEARLRAILHDALPGECADLVVDDASHFVDLTRRTFNCLFPHVRPGGTYAIEDWSWGHTAQCGFWRTTDEAPLTVLIFELILACGTSPNVVASVDVFGNIALVTRGEAELDPANFDLCACFDLRDRALISERGSHQVPDATTFTTTGPADRWALAKSLPSRAPISHGSTVVGRFKPAALGFVEATPDADRLLYP